MIIKGVSCAGAKRLAAHLTRTDTNERAEVREIRGVVAETLIGALREMEAVAAGTRTKKPFYHASINTPADEPLTDAQRLIAIDRLETALGLTGQPRVVVLHVKEGREHCHIVWSRIDIDRMAAISDSHNYRRHEQVARELEREFGLERVQGAHIEREGKVRPRRTPSHAEMSQGDRTGVRPQEAKVLMTALWRSTENGREFEAALARMGWILARGDRRDFVAVDHAGAVHSLTRRIDGARAADVRERMADIDRDALPSVAAARAEQRQRFDEASRAWVEARGAINPSPTASSARDDGMEWTHRGGMAQQQRSALKEADRRAKDDAQPREVTERARRIAKRVAEKSEKGVPPPDRGSERDR